VLDLYERRVLGVLIEKQKTTPDAYPLSMNGLITGCNQKSNREPTLNLEDLDVEAALNSLKDKGLVIRVQGAGRVERWRHNVYDTWQVEKVEVAVLADLLLRGAQTEGELRGHVSRMEPVEDLDTLRRILEKLAARKLVVYLTPPGQRGSRLTHGFHPAKELESLRAGASAEVAPPVRSPAAPPSPPAALPSPPPPPPVPAVKPEQLTEVQQALDQARTEIDTLRKQLTEVQGALAAVRQELQELKQALGA
jgi:uncharacterized protein YceH (UPF0502 family)